MKIKERLKMFGGLLSSSTNLSIWSFTSDKELLFSTSNYKSEFSTFFSLSGCLDYVFSKSKLNKPIILGNSLDLFWIAETIDASSISEGFECVLIIGPIFCSDSSLISIEKSLSKMNLSINLRNEMLNILTDVPMISIESIHQFAIMMHYAIHEDVIKSRDILYQKKLKHDNGDDVDVAAVLILEEESYIKEQIFLRSIKEGNLVYKQLLDLDTYFGIDNDRNIQIDKIRSLKNYMFMLIGFCRSAAIEGGVPFKIAKEIEKKAFLKIEKCDTTSKVYFGFVETVEELVVEVRRSSNNPNISKDILECCSYIKSNILEPITLEDIAHEVGYSEYYLTKKFHKETGIKLIDYIKQSKIELAKIYLETTSKSVQEISELLHFTTRNYFNRVFQELVGMSPNKYRNSKKQLDDEVKNETV